MRDKISRNTKSFRTELGQANRLRVDFFHISKFQT